MPCSARWTPPSSRDLHPYTWRAPADQCASTRCFRWVGCGDRCGAPRPPSCRPPGRRRPSRRSRRPDPLLPSRASGSDPDAGPPIPAIWIVGGSRHSHCPLRPYLHRVLAVHRPSLHRVTVDIWAARAVGHHDYPPPCPLNSGTANAPVVPSTGTEGRTSRDSGRGREANRASMVVASGRLMKMTARLGCAILGAGSMADRLTAVGIDADSRVEASGLGGE